ncbi:hypothetical protein L2719_08215 [Shewanella schlegeliana]|uniref:Anti-sigma factor n=1 Tax=Shewanella schlegeliana TaxID=190308 RepID=A0ABS1T0D3_9GAMM|nr:hypothetical protein [Shewanella schlegeliana]MBL4914251.1 hypothetical protein [Shewanella schlegeliana]MCL1109524.1 hypothetical protein [Shewanella schlegeliana]GIU33686.1 anti-sigma factor [Shewanella schlegeliana]
MNDASAKLTQLINQAPREIAPQKELWNDIERQLDKVELDQPQNKAQQRPVFRRLAVASIILLVGLLGMNIWQHNGELSTLATPSPLLATLAEIKLQHQLQVEQLSQQQHLTNWQASELGLPLENGIEQLRKAAEQIYQALQQTPNDKELWQLWLWTQQREIELLQQGQTLPVNPLPQGV